MWWRCFPPNVFLTLLVPLSPVLVDRSNEQICVESDNGGYLQLQIHALFLRAVSRLSGDQTCRSTLPTDGIELAE